MRRTSANRRANPTGRRLRGHDEVRVKRAPGATTDSMNSEGIRRSILRDLESLAAYVPEIDLDGLGNHELNQVRIRARRARATAIKQRNRERLARIRESRRALT